MCWQTDHPSIQMRVIACAAPSFVRSERANDSRRQRARAGANALFSTAAKDMPCMRAEARARLSRHLPWKRMRASEHMADM